LFLAEVAERRVPEIVSGRGRLHHHRIAPAEVADEFTGAVIGVVQGDRDRPGHGRDLERMGQAVVNDSSGTGLRNHLSDRGQPGEERGEPDPFDIDAERVLSGAGHLGDIALATTYGMKSLTLHQTRLPIPGLVQHRFLETQITVTYGQSTCRRWSR